MDLGVWGCHLRLGGLMQISLCWSDFSLSSQADHPGGQLRHLPGGHQGLVLLVLSLRAIAAMWGWWLVGIEPLRAPAFWKTTLPLPPPTPVIKAGLASSLHQGGLRSVLTYEITVLHWPKQLARGWSHDPIRAWESQLGCDFENEVFLVSSGLKPSEKEVWSLGQRPYQLCLKPSNSGVSTCTIQ